ncbi:TRAP transporter large permease [Treponema brennaborense]|uniref:TRAP dicarboxylate transporter, DctM subunit n=1 Tax=Treponema brennaborense (strain DSM 12168 / CIP 105900 / DD5/3) TaxID=906968 RepID=F4LIB7_TREBD|nr:TRAP transporter large permease [Treponema brennaborense]AEE16158.1 TRAP dicarboxylate transporter, DctM subunit [Treponema brennaborense DSM 12168]
MYDPSIAIWLLLGSFVVFVICKMPVVFALAVSSCITMLYMGIPLMAFIQQMGKAVNSFSLMAIPFFVFAGELMGAGGISNRLLDCANAIVGRFRGGLSYVNVLGSMFFGHLSGSAVADVSSLGSVEIPMMEKAGYDKDFSVAITVASSCQGVLIPPSHNMIIYSVAAGGVSVGALFMAGLVPGILCGIMLLIVCFVLAQIRHYPKGEKIPFKRAVKIVWNALLALFTAVIILVGVTAGIFTATESAAIACIYAFIISVFVYRELKLTQIPRLLMNTVKTLAMVFSLIAAAGAFGYLLAMLRVPSMITQGLMAISSSKVVIFLLINLMLLLLGCIMDMAPLILIVTPILVPVVQSFGMSPVQFGVMLIFNLAVGLCTPPVGSALFVGCGIGKISVERTVKAMLPMYAAMIVGLLLVTFVPSISLFLPRLLGYAV